MALIDMQLPMALLQTADGFMICIAQTILITTSSKFVAAFIPVAVVVLYLLQSFYLRTSRQIRLLDLEAKSPMYTHFLETLSGLTTLRAFNWQYAWDERSRELLDRSQRPVYMLYCIQRWLGLALDSMVAICALLIITLATQLNQSASSSGGALGVALVNLLTLSNMLSYLIRAWTDLETSIGAVLRVREFESSTPSEIFPNESQGLPDDDWPRYGAIKFQNVDASYSIPSVSSEVTDRSLSSPVLKNITLKIPAGSHVGICGRTGSGKSSLLLTLFHLIEITSGVLSIDDVDIRNLNRNTLRSRLVAVPQSPELFPGTLRSNLDPESYFTDDVIIAELQRVELWTLIQSRGGLRAEADQTPLSHGERQLFALACALLRRQTLRYSAETGGILILDEVSAPVDVETELRISRIVREQFAGWTVLSVAHRLSTIRESDLVIVMDSGRAIEFGKLADLEGIKGSFWREMVG
jgi:ATP-binding cassette subfamily C (CFTR/MRP) protein 1